MQQDKSKEVQGTGHGARGEGKEETREVSSKK